MPIYEYRCRGCGHPFEALVRPVDPPPSCPACRSQDLERAISLFAAKSDDRSRAAFNAARKKVTKARQEKDAEEYAHALREHEEHEH